MHGARLENLVACALRKEIDRLEDEQGERMQLHYLRSLVPWLASLDLMPEKGE